MDALSFKHYIDIVYRRRWWIVVPLILGLAAGGFALTRLPKVYRGVTTILVTPQRLPEDFVRTTVTTSVDEAMRSLTVQLLSRRYLEQIVKDFYMVPPTHTDDELEQACNRVARSVEINMDRRTESWFQIVVEDTDPGRSAGIANRLAELFIEQNTKRREAQAESTLEDVERWLEDKSSTLSSKEAAIAAFRRDHPWELPEDLAANLQLMNTATQQLAAADDSIREIEDDLSLLRSQSASEAVPNIVLDRRSAANPDLERYRELKQRLADLRSRYTDENPAVRSQLAKVEEFEGEHPEVVLMSAGPGAEPEEGEQAPMSPLEMEIARRERELAAEKRERRQLEAKIAEYTRRIENIPLREAELSKLTRDLDAIRADYSELLEQREQARRAEQMEASRKGEQFEIQDRAKVPSRPFKPNPVMFILASGLAGLALGVGLTVALEFFDDTIRSEDQFRETFPDVKLLVSIPAMGSERKYGASRKSKPSRGRVA